MTAFTWEDFESTVVPFSTLRPIIFCSKSSTPHHFTLGKIAVERTIFVKKDINTEENLISSPNHFWTHQPIQQPTNKMKLFGIILLALATINTASIAHRSSSRIRLRNKVPNNRHNRGITGNVAGGRMGAPLRRKARDMQVNHGGVDADWIEFYTDPFYPYFEQYASVRLGFPATVTDPEFQDLVLGMTDDEWYSFFSTLGNQVLDWVDGNDELIITMSDDEFETMSNSIKW